jgi:hypothetical protein
MNFIATRNNRNICKKRAGESSPACTLEDGIRVMELALAAREG